jgi:hypothetical protein
VKPCFRSEGDFWNGEASSGSDAAWLANWLALCVARQLVGAVRQRFQRRGL